MRDDLDEAWATCQRPGCGHGPEYHDHANGCIECGGCPTYIGRLDLDEDEFSDVRSALVLAEPIWGQGTADPSWHGMTFVAGKVVNDITGSNRAAVLTDCWDALDAEGVETEYVPSDEDYDRTDGHA